MITQSFDPVSPEIVCPAKTIREEEKALAAPFHIHSFLIVFSGALIRLLLEDGLIEPLDERLTIGSAAFRNPIYRICGSEIGIVLSGIGAPMAAAIVEELLELFPCRRFLVFGSSGALVDLPEGRVIVPTEAYRDEGCSYHYAPASSWIRIRNAERLASLLERLGVPCIKGKTWTTDAFYRETESNKAQRVQDGCICVEMECSALQAVCDYRGTELYQFVYTADSLHGSWSRRILGELEKDMRLLYFGVARKLAELLETEDNWETA